MSLSIHDQLAYAALAVQLSYLDPQRFAALVADWLAEPQDDLSDILLRRRLITEDQKSQLDRLVDETKRGQPRDHLTAAFDGVGSGRRTTRGGGQSNQGTEIGASRTGDEGDGETISFSPHEPVGVRYLSLRPLARGGLGKVTVARDTELDREVALKEVLETKRHSPGAIDRFLAEAKITGGLEHPGIVPVYGLEIDDEGMPRYAMRLIRGESLDAAIKRLHSNEPTATGNRSDRDFRRLVQALIAACNATAYAHSRGVVHRDIKPQNIMLWKYGETLLVDWGLSKVMDSPTESDFDAELPMEDSRPADSDRTSMGTILGTASFMSPEQAFGRLDLVGPASDVFCLGSTLYAILTGDGPYRGTTREETIRAAQEVHFDDPREVNPAVPKPLRAICLKAMARRADERYASPFDLAADLDRWLAGEPVTAMREPLITRVARRVRKHQTAVATIAGMVLVALVGSLVANVLVGSQRNVAIAEGKFAEQMRVRAVQMQTTAEAEAERATSNSQAMLEVIDRFVQKMVDDQEWASLPGFESQRIEMVDLAVDQCCELMKDDSENALLLEKTIQLLVRSAHLCRVSGETQAALAQLERLDALLNAEKSKSLDIDLLGMHADALSVAADLNLLLDGPAAALPVSERHLELAEQRLRDSESKLMPRLGLLKGSLQHAMLCYEVSRFDEVRQHASRARECARPLESTLGNQMAFRFLQISVDLIDASASIQLGDFDDAAKRLATAEGVTEEARKQFLGDNNIDYVYALGLQTRGQFLLASGASEKAIEHFRKALEVDERIAREHPGVVSYKTQVADVHSWLAAALWEQGELAASRTEALNAFAVGEQEQSQEQASEAADDERADLGGRENSAGESAEYVDLAWRVRAGSVLTLTASDDGEASRLRQDLQHLQQTNDVHTVFAERAVEQAISQLASPELASPDGSL